MPSPSCTSPQPDEASLEVWDALLWVASTVWKNRRSGPLPDPGEQIVLHHGLPAAQVVSVVEPRGESVSAALLRLPRDPPQDGCQVEEWATLLQQEGWTPQR